MRLITDVPNLSGRYVLLRASLNVPLEDGTVRDTYRLEHALATMRYLSAEGAKTIVVGHIGREPEETLRPVLSYLQEHIAIHWGGVVGTPECDAARNGLVNGELLLLENLRQDAREVANEPEFSKLLAALADVYVDDAFANVHREHASMVGVTTHLPAYAGLNVAREVAGLTPALQPAHPAVFLLGGAKFATKLPLLERYIDTYDTVFVGGALLNDVLRARGYEVGQSLVSDMSLKGQALIEHPNLMMAVDVVVLGPEGQRTVPIDGVAPDERIIDIGPATVALLAPVIASANMILWNGPLGWYEGGAAAGTHDVAQCIAAAPGHSIVGGGDTVAAISTLGIDSEFGFISTGGGAMLTFLEYGTTPALQALE